jgi:TolB-like protein/predicted Ser/Thr protein kinase
MIGQTIAHYRIVKLLGRGAMGEVYEARDTKLDMRVAIKLVASDDVSPDDRARLLREAQVMASLNHRFIGSVHLVGEDEGRLFIVMELVDGPTLADVLADGPLAPDRACTLLDQLAAAMSHAHGRGVVHRDLKPANIMLTAEGEPRIMDFGLAVRRDQSGTFDADGFGGTLAYIAPEQASGADPDELTDIWSLGVVFYEVLTGRPPFRGEYSAALLYDIAHGTPPPVAESAPRAAALQESLVDRLLAKDRAARFRSMDAVREAVRTVAVARSRRRPVFLVAIAATLLAIAVALVLWPDQAVPPLRGPSVAVMPLETHSADGDLRDFATGFSGEVIAELAKVSDLRVIAQSSMRALAGETLSPADIAGRLGVDHVVGGTVRQDGDNLRISAELLDARDSRVLWAESFEADPSGALILQASVARAVAATLKGQLSDREERALSTSAQIDPGAYRNYVRAMALIQTWGNRSIWLRAIKLLRQTTTLEPTFAPAWAALARIYHFLGWIDTSPEKDYLGMCRAAIGRALELDPDLPAVHAVRGLTLCMYDQDFAAADDAFQTALALAPGDAYTHREYATSLLVMTRRCDEAVAHSRRAVALSPLDPSYRREHALALVNCRHFEDALAFLDEVGELLPQAGFVWYYRAACLAYLGRDDEAAAAADSAVSYGMRPHQMAAVHWVAGRRDEAWQAFGGRDAARDSVPPEQRFSYPFLLMLEGDADRVLDSLEAMLPAKKPLLMYQIIDPIYDPIREHPRFIALTEALNMTAW